MQFAKKLQHRPTWPCRLSPQERFARKNETQHLRMAFERLDANKDGHIDAEELRSYFDAVGHKTKKVCWGGCRAALVQRSCQ